MENFFNFLTCHAITTLLATALLLPIFDTEVFPISHALLKCALPLLR